MKPARSAHRDMSAQLMLMHVLITAGSFAGLRRRSSALLQAEEICTDMHHLQTCRPPSDAGACACKNTQHPMDMQAEKGCWCMCLWLQEAVSACSDEVVCSQPWRHEHAAPTDMQAEKGCWCMSLWLQEAVSACSGEAVICSRPQRSAQTCITHRHAMVRVPVTAGSYTSMLRRSSGLLLAMGTCEPAWSCTQSAQTAASDARTTPATSCQSSAHPWR